MNRRRTGHLTNDIIPMESLTLIRPDDWHVHLRDGDALHYVVPDTALQFGRALVMPNLRPPVATVAEALLYRDRILCSLPADSGFDPRMALYLTDRTPVPEIARAAEDPHILGFKLYPTGATTHSEAGVADLGGIHPMLEAMETHDVPLMIHGEVTDPDIDIFDREKAFIDRYLLPMTERFPGLRITFEHITTADAVQFLGSRGERVAATITAHHLLYSRNALFVGGLHPHYYCLPVLKRERHRQALLTAATSGEDKFFLGTDSAPHPRSQKESACGCAGCYTAHAALELYATAFESFGALDRLEGFASIAGARFYGLPINTDRVTLEKREWEVPEQLGFSDGERLIPLMAGQTMRWRLRSPPR